MFMFDDAPVVVPAEPIATGTPEWFILDGLWLVVFSGL